MVTVKTAVVFLLVAPHVPAQGSLADYERTRTLAKSTRGTVTGARVRPRWLPGGTRFWYANDLGRGRREFVLVDAETATRKELFDPERLALALSKATGSPVEADKLGIAALALDENAMQLWRRGERQTWSCDLETYQLQQRKLEESSVFALKHAEQSNVTNAHRLEGKLLLIVGELDRNVDPASTMQVVDALVRAGSHRSGVLPATIVSDTIVAW